MFIQRLTQSLLILLSLIAMTVYGKSHIQQATIFQEDQTLLVNVNSQINFPKAVTEAIHSGVTLEFNYQFEIKEEKWYRPQPLIKINKVYYLSYYRMTNQYVIVNPITYEEESFSTLFEAKQFMETVQAFPLILHSKVPENATVLGIRFHLANTNLPSYIRIERVFSDDWAIDSDWQYWQLP